MKTASLPWQSLRRVLRQLHDALNSLAQLLVQEETVMTRLDRDRITVLVEQKSQALETFHRYEQELVTVLRPWVPTGSSAECWALIRSAPECKALALYSLFEMIIATAQQVREQGRRNAALIRRGQYVVQEALNQVQAGLGQGPVYQGSGILRQHPVPCSVNLHG